MYSGDGETRRLIDTLQPGESFILGGFTFRVEDKLPPTRKVVRSASDAMSPGEKPRNYLTLEQIVAAAGRKAGENAKGKRDRSQNGGNEQWRQSEMIF